MNRTGFFRQLAIALLITLCGGMAHAGVSFSPSAVGFSNTQVGSMSPTVQITATNVGSVPVTIGSLSFAGGNAGFTVLTSTCSSSLPAGNSCTVDLAFFPSSMGPKLDNFYITVDSLPSAFVPLQGLATGVCQFTPTTGSWNVAANWGGDCGGTIVPGANDRAEITGKTVTLLPGTTTIGDLYFGSATIQGADSTSTGSTLVLLDTNPVAWASGTYFFTNMTLDVQRSSTALFAISGALVLNNAVLKISSGTTAHFGTSSLTSQVNGAGGSIENSGVLYLDGDFSFAGTPNKLFNFSNSQLLISNTDVTVSGAIVNDGVVEVGTARTLTLTAANLYSNNDNASVLKGYGTISAAGQVLTVGKGDINGALTFNVAELVSGAFMTPGSEAPSTIGNITVQGKLTLTAGSKVKIRTQGPGPGNTSSIAIAGSGSTLAGELEVELINSYIAPTPGDNIIGLTYPGGPPSGATGSFSSVTTSGPGFWLPTYNAGSVTLTAAAASTLVISPTSLSFGQLNVGLMSPPQTVSVVNSGIAPVTFASDFDSVDFGTDGFVFGPGTCQGAVLQQNDSCTITVSLFPSSVGVTTVDYADFLLAASDAGPISPASAIATGEGLSLPLDVLPGQKVFPNTPVGDSSGQSFAIINNTASAGTPVIVASGDFIDYGGCSSINPGGSCSIYVEFQPTVVGPATGSLVITLGAETRTISLSGNGVPGLIASPTTVNFGSLTAGSSSSVQTVTITKAQGIGCLDYNAPTIGGPDAASVSISSNTCGAASFASSCQLGLVFNASGAAGARSASLTISGSYGAGCQSQPALAPPQDGLKSALSKFSMAKPAAPVSSVSIAISANVAGSLGVPVITSGAPFGGLTSRLYFHNFVATGTGPITWSIFSGSLPPGLILNTSTGQVSGTPTQVGTFVFTVRATGPGGQANQSTSITISVPIVSVISVNPSSLDFGSQNVGTVSVPQTVTVLNEGNGPFDVRDVGGVGDFGFSSTCAGTIGPGRSCTVTVTFAPLSAGPLGGLISVNTTAQQGGGSISLSGTGVQVPRPNFVLNPSSGLIFGDQAVGTVSAPQIAFISNTGTARLEIRDAELRGAGFLRVSPLPEDNPRGHPGCGGSLEAGRSCALGIAFAPVSVGAASGALVFTHNGTPTGSFVQTSLGFVGNGTPRREALIRTSGGLSFGEQVIGTASALQVVTVTNSGTLNLSVGSVVVVPTNAQTSAGDFQATSFCGTVAPNGNCRIEVRFTPGGLATEKAANLSIASNATNAASAVVGLSGVALAVPEPRVRLSASAIGFGNVLYFGVAPPQVVTVTNVGTRPLQVSGVTATAGYVESNDCLSRSLAVGQGCAITVRFVPQVLGAVIGTLTIESNAPSSPDNVSLSGSNCPPLPPNQRGFVARNCGP